MSKKTSRLPSDLLDPFASTTAPAVRRSEVAPAPEPVREAVVSSASEVVEPVSEQVPPVARRAQAPERAQPAPVRPAAPVAPVAPAATAAPTPGIAGGRRLTPVTSLKPRGYTAGGRPPAPDLLQMPPVRVTAYLRPDQLEFLRDVVRERQMQGMRSDVSALLREAVDLLRGS